MKCEYCFQTSPNKCELGSMVIRQEKKGGMSDDNFQRYLIRISQIDICARPDLRNRAIRKAAEKRDIEPPV